MEILYIWVKEYGNIKEQGFNFSSEYRFKGALQYNIKNENKNDFFLCVERNENYVKDFFNISKCPKLTCKISNVSAFIGENGAGKTTILSFIKNNLISGSGGIWDIAVVIISDGQKKTIYHHDSLKLNIKSKKDEFVIKPYNEKQSTSVLDEARNTSFIFYSNIFDYTKGENALGENHNISVNYLIHNDKHDGWQMGYCSSNSSEVKIFRHNEVKRQLAFVNYFKKGMEYIKFKIPDEVNISINSVTNSTSSASQTLASYPL